MFEIKADIPKNTRKRLTLLLEFLNGCKKEKVTSIEISQALGCKDSLIRFDLRYVRFSGGVSNGYDVNLLKKEVGRTLGLSFCADEKNAECVKDNIAKCVKKLCIVGLGRLGAALLDQGIFYESGFEVCAGFDSSLNRVELLRSTFELYPASRIESVIPQQKIEYAILCCAENEAQKMADRLVKAGIKGIVNYTRAVVRIPTEVKIENVSPVLALQMMN